MEKLRFDDETLPDSYGITEDLWLDDVTKWPSVEFGDLYTYLIVTKGPFTKEKLKAYKSLEAYSYFHDGYIRTVQGHLITLLTGMKPEVCCTSVDSVVSLRRC